MDLECFGNSAMDMCMAHYSSFFQAGILSCPRTAKLHCNDQSEI